MASTPESIPRSENRLLHLLGQNALKISELEAENRILQARVSELLQSRVITTSKTANVPRETDGRLPKDSGELRQAYEVLKAQHTQTEQLLQIANTKYSMAKRRVFEWHAYAQKLLSKIDSLKSEAAKRSTAAQNQLPAADSTSELRLSREAPSTTIETRILNRSTIPRITSSQSTVYEPQVEPDLPKHEDDEEPTLVSERQLKRRRLDTRRSPRIKKEGVSASAPFIIASDEPDIPLLARIVAQVSNLDDVVDSEPAPVRPAASRTPEQASVSRVLSCTNSSGLREQQNPNKRRALKTISSNIPSANSIARPQNLKAKTAIKVTPLRSLPVEDLQLRDFCPNPYYTGPAMTFFEPLKADRTRTCLPGCTRAACCGNKYRRAVEIGGAQVTGKTNEEVLEDYLGPKWREILLDYPPEKRKDFITRAHALSFARQTGAQSKATIRPPTPPGFWRTDMPSTQELQEYKAEADELERRRIAERYHEATREGGQWLFRDEAQ